MPQNVEIYLSKQLKFNSTYHIHYLTPNNYLRNFFLIPCAYHSTICQLHVAALLLTHFFLKISFMSLCLIFCQRRSSHSLAQHFIFHSYFFSLLLWTQRCYLPLVVQLPHCLRLRCCVICNIMFFFSTHKLLFYFNFAFVARLFTCLASFIFRLRFVVS